MVGGVRKGVLASIKGLEFSGVRDSQYRGITIGQCLGRGLGSGNDRERSVSMKRDENCGLLGCELACESGSAPRGDWDVAVESSEKRGSRSAGICTLFAFVCFRNFLNGDSALGGDAELAAVEYATTPNGSMVSGLRVTRSPARICECRRSAGRRWMKR